MTTLIQSMNNQSIELKEMLQELHDKIDAKNAFVQSKPSNLVEQASFKITPKAPRMTFEKASL